MFLVLVGWWFRLRFAGRCLVVSVDLCRVDWFGLWLFVDFG